MNIAIFGGSFDPIHNGHMLLAEEVRNAFNMDCIYFVPTYLSPHKQSKAFANAYHRLNMIELAIKDNKYFRLSTVEIERKGVSYTIDTVSSIKKTLSPNDKVHLIIGADLIDTISTWKDYRELIKQVHFIVVKRERHIKDEYLTMYPFMKIIDNIVFDISSSIVRKKIKESKSIKYLVPIIVQEYIEKENIYKQNK